MVRFSVYLTRMTHWKVDKARDEGCATARLKRKPSLAHPPPRVHLFCKKMKMDLILKASPMLATTSTSVILSWAASELNKKAYVQTTYNWANIFPLHRFVIIYGHILLHPSEVLNLDTDIQALLYSNCFLLHIPKGNSSCLQFSRVRLHLPITSSTPLPSQGTIVYDPFST